MTEYETAKAERDIAEAKRKGYQQALNDLQTYLRERLDSIEWDHGEMSDQFKYGVHYGFDKVLTWTFEKTTF